MFVMAEAGLGSLPSERLEAEMTTLAAHIHAGTARFLSLVAEFDRRGLYDSWECRSTAQWLTWKCGISARTAREHVKVARTMGSLPAATDAFVRGELSFAKMRAMTRVLDVVPEGELMNLATSMTAGQLERTLGAVARVRRNLTQPPQARQSMRTWWDDDTMFHLTATLAADDALIVQSAMATVRKRRETQERAAKAAKAAAATEGGDDGGNGSAEPLSDAERAEFDPDIFQRRAAQDLIDLARTTLGIEPQAGPPTQVLIHADLDLLIGLTDTGRAHIDNGPPLPPDLLGRLIKDGSWRLIIEDKHRNPLYVGRKHKDPNTLQRVAVWSRSGGVCETPNCDNRMVHIHHAHWWSQGGPTDIDYLTGRCARCHTLIHKGLLHVTAQGNQTFHTTDHTGRTITATTPPVDLNHTTIEHTNTQAGIACGPNTCASLDNNAPFNLRYVVDTTFHNYDIRQAHTASAAAAAAEAAQDGS